MDLSDGESKPLETEDTIEKDLSFVLWLRSLAQHNNLDKPVWGIFSSDNFDEQTTRRLQVRVFISLVESVLFTLKNEALEGCPNKFSQAELALLADKVFEISDKGEAIERPYFVQIEKNLKFTFRCYIKGFDLDYVPDYNGSGWKAFRETVKIRNRITHPKRNEKMKVDDNEQQMVEDAYDWFVKTRRDLLDARIEKLRSSIDKLRSSLDQVTPKT